MLKKRITNICVALAAVIGFGIFASLLGGESPALLRASAANAKYEMSEGYRSGKYYDNLSKINLTGDQKKDVIAIALSQLGYHEGNGENELDGLSTSGTKDFVEYNVLYGKLDNKQGNGNSYGYYWCASFVNWCLRHAGVPATASAGAEVSCQRWITACQGEGIYSDKKGYTPQSGDMIFFRDLDSSVSSTHVGLVLHSDNTKVYTVEGNTSNGDEFSSDGEYVALKSYPLGSQYIVGYATPEYNTEKSYKRVDQTSAFRTAGQYITLDATEVHSTDKLDSASGNIEAFRVVDVSEVGSSYLKVTYSDNGESKEGYVAKETLRQVTSSVNVYMINYLSESGRAMFYPQYRVSGEQKATYTNSPKRENCGFVGWELKNGKYSTVFEPGEKLPNYDDDITLYSVWDENYYVVTFKDTDGKIIEQAHGYYGTKFELPDAPEAPEGQVFVGWGEEIDGIIRSDASYSPVFMSEEEYKEVMGSGEDETGEAPKGCSSSVGAVLAIPLAAFASIPAFVRKKEK